MTFRLGLLIVVVCIALSSCSKLFSPRGSGEIPDTDQTETLLKAHVFHLADTIGERNVYHPGSMERSARYIEQKLEGMGYAVTRQAVHIPPSGEFGAVKDWTAYNLIAIKKGTSPQPKMLIVGAHYDGTGTGDNGSGIALALTTAQKLFAVETEYTVVFVFFTAEELGLYGSEAYAQNMTQEEIDNTLYMINIDSVVCGDYCYLYGGVQDNENQTVTDTEAFDNAWAVAESLGLSFKKNPWTWGNLSPENYDDVTYYAYSFFDSAEFLRYDSTLDKDEVGNKYTSYKSSAYSEGISYLYYEDEQTAKNNPLYTMFVDYSYTEVTVTADSTESGGDDGNEEETTNDTNMWLFISSLVIAIALIIAVVGLLIQKLVKKAHLKKARAGASNAASLNAAKRRYAKKEASEKKEAEQPKKEEPKDDGDPYND